ncbi:N-acetylmuramoyl-L-alanine amidase [Nitrospirillum sp. BR 11828]|uniref:N-acetylmuramoyl-L-alanine amidase family protein n=1 Tax=Nitrospirillum sp. BR 11828 TaxID=3104325 RepID=UPI002ACA2124|nr:N-acetylmuramoyl-L-alanine amidase [Nitrospirillum sp. BR 11828]MDZ5646148.1 N-acetylmuramoyl-L-alanine amidase [Nitrospirillum sp. BR 11828]
MDRRAILRLAVGIPFLGVGGIVRPGQAEHLVKPVAAAVRPPAALRTPRLVMIDPGHGGKDPGAIGHAGTYEKDVTLDLAKELALQLRKTQGLSAGLTREDDHFLELGERVDVAREAKADLFLSIHADSAPNANARGLSAYTLSEKASDAFSQALADKENYADRLGLDLKHTKPVVADILMDLATRRTKAASLVARQGIVRGAGHDLHLLDNPMRSANFVVLRAPDIPSVLVETGFLSNRQDEALLRDPAQRKRIAGILARELATLLASPTFA